MQYLFSYMALNVGQIPLKNEENSFVSRNVVIQKDTENSIGRVSKQEGRLKEKGHRNNTSGSEKDIWHSLGT